MKKLLYTALLLLPLFAFYQYGYTKGSGDKAEYIGVHYYKAPIYEEWVRCKKAHGYQLVVSDNQNWGGVEVECQFLERSVDIKEL